MEINIEKKVKVQAKTLKLHLKVCDEVIDRHYRKD
jgi:hypothetical protein